MEDTTKFNCEEESKDIPLLAQTEKEPSNLISKVLKDIISDYKENEDVFHDDCLPTCLNSSDLDLLKIPDYEVLAI